jgi:hypothetical protein
MYEHGYSVIVLTVALAVLATVATVGWSSGTGALDRYRLWAASCLLASDIRASRMRAVSRTLQVEIVFCPNQPWRYDVYDAGESTPWKSVNLRDYCPRVDVLPPNTSLALYPSGTCRGGTVTLSRRGALRRVVCSLVGRVRCFWDQP